jgi:hypothetical protein
MKFPDNTQFAFSILDDTDDSTLSNIQPVYDLLWKLGFRTTKTAWPFDCPEGSKIFFAAETLQNKEYLEYTRTLMDRGFELGFHGATMRSSRRDRTYQALEYFKNEFGTYPRIFCNHGNNRENLYWGYKRFQAGIFRELNKIIKKKEINCFDGEIDDSEYFWGDLCREHIQYVRNFTFNRLNMLEVNPEIPYRIPKTKYVNAWFSTADAPDVNAFNKLLTFDRIDELERTGGVCLISTHFGKGFVKGGKINTTTSEILRYIASKNGWFVPVSAILDYLSEKRGSQFEMSYSECFRLEFRYIVDKIMSKG